MQEQSIYLLPQRQLLPCALNWCLSLFIPTEIKWKLFVLGTNQSRIEDKKCLKLLLLLLFECAAHLALAHRFLQHHTHSWRLHFAYSPIYWIQKICIKQLWSITYKCTNGFQWIQDRRQTCNLSSHSDVPHMATHTQCKWFFLFYRCGNTCVTSKITMLCSSAMHRSSGMWGGNGEFGHALNRLQTNPPRIWHLHCECP